MQIHVKASAKINLFLNIKEKRPDDFHEIRSVLLPVRLYDRISIEQQDRNIETVVANSIEPFGVSWSLPIEDSEENLTTRAARLLKKVTGYRGGASIFLEKRIPIGAGLGGGSSNAAAVLKGLNRLWKTELSREELKHIGSQLGSDIPAFIHGGVVYMEGRGEQVKSIAQHSGLNLWFILVNPGFGISTADIYSRYNVPLTFRKQEAKFRTLIEGLTKDSCKKISYGLFNALQKTVFRKYPILEMIKNKLEKAGALGVLLSGTGSTIFGLVWDAHHGHEVKEQLVKALGCPLWIKIVKAFPQ